MREKMQIKAIFIALILSHLYASGIQKPILSILICTLEERKQSFNKITTILRKQIRANKLQGKIEIRFFLDNREHSVGYKRNVLLDQAQGDYVVSVDDDDAIHPNYIRKIYKKLLKRPDCVGLTATMTRNGLDAKPLIHSIIYKEWFVKDDIYYRPPNHLTPIKRDIAKHFKFPEINSGEDVTWSMNIAASGLLKKEVVIKKPFYFYDYSPESSCTTSRSTAS